MTQQQGNANLSPKAPKPPLEGVHLVRFPGSSRVFDYLLIDNRQETGLPYMTAQRADSRELKEKEDAGAMVHRLGKPNRDAIRFVLELSKYIPYEPASLDVVTPQKPN